MKQVTLREFIEKELCGSIEQTMVNFPYFAFGTIAIGIEFLGNCMDSDGWNAKHLSKKRFDKAINTLPSLTKYKDANLYTDLRCGMAHMMAPNNSLLVANNEGAYSAQDRTLYIKTFYQDFKEACQYLINNSALWGGNGKSPETIWWEVYEIENSNPTGNTMDSKTEQSDTKQQ